MKLEENTTAFFQFGSPPDMLEQDLVKVNNVWQDKATGQEYTSLLAARLAFIHLVEGRENQ